MKKTRWDVLSVKDKASLIKLFVNNGIVSLKDMIDMYNTHTFSDGGDKDELELSGGALPEASVTAKKIEKRSTPNKDTFIPSNFIIPIEQPIERRAQLVNDYLVNQYNTIQEDVRDYLNNTTFLGDPVRTPNESLQYLKDLQDEQQYLEDLSAIKNINRYSRGGKIHIKASKRGTFTAAASKHNKSVAEFAAQVLANPERYSPAMVKKANFARNARKWKHDLGGYLFEDGGEEEIFDEINPALFSLRDLAKLSRRQIKQAAEQDAYENDRPTLNSRRNWQQRVYNRTYDKYLRDAAKQKYKQDLFNLAVEELQSGKPTGAFKELTREGIEDVAPFAMGLVNTAALPALSSLVPLGAAGRGAAKGLEWIGEKAMPSALLKSPVWRGTTARAFQAAAPYADAAALSYWSALAGNTTYNAIRNKDWGTASASGAMTLLPLAPAAFNVVKDARNILNAPRISPQKDIGSQIAYRVINDAGFDDLINSGLIRPNPEGPFSHPGIQGGTWFSLDAPVTSQHPTILPNGNRVSYRGNYVIEIGDKSPQFPKGTTPGTEGLNYRLGAMEINPRDSFIRIQNRKTGKYISPKEYIMHSPYVSETLEAQRAAQEASRAAVETSPINSALNTSTQASAVSPTPYVIQDLGGGYMLKSLMRGNPLEKQIGKNGTVNVNNIKAVIGKGSKVEQAVVDKVLASEEFVGKKSIDYNKFRKAVQDELITYDRTPDTRWADYGMSRIRQGHGGHPNAVRAIENAKSYEDRFNTIDIYGSAEERQSVRDLTYLLREGKISETEYDRKFDSIYNQFSDRYVGNSTPETFTFSSSRIPKGADNHYDENTLGHSRTYTTTDEPDVLHVMESQSDWAQHADKSKLGKYRISSAPDEEGISRVNVTLDRSRKKFIEVRPGEGIKTDVFWDEYFPEYKKQFDSNFPNEQAKYLIDNYTTRQIQENLRYAAEKGQTKMRYPTRETAAKIEGYTKNRTRALQEDPELQKEYDNIGKALREEEKRIVKKYAPDDYLDDYLREADFGDMNLSEEETNRLVDQIRRSEEFDRSPEAQKMRDEIIAARQKLNQDKWLEEHAPEMYLKEHETILKKYDAFPKQFKKLYKNADVRIVTDSKGNTWYEVDVPENYLKQEWKYSTGGILRKANQVKAFEEAAAKRGYLAEGGKMYGPGGLVEKITDAAEKFVGNEKNVRRLAQFAERHPKTTAKLSRTIREIIPEDKLFSTAVLAHKHAWSPEPLSMISDEFKKSGVAPSKSPTGSIYGEWADPGNSYLLTPDSQKNYMERLGYHLLDNVSDSDYGLVKSAATALGDKIGRRLPVYQKGDDYVSRDKIVPIYNGSNTLTGDSSNGYENPIFYNHIVQYDDNYREQGTLSHAGAYPFAVYAIPGTNEYVYKAWDLNDYGNHGSSGGVTYGPDKTIDEQDHQYLANLYDILGEPFVQTTGYTLIPSFSGKKLPTEKEYNEIYNRIAGQEKYTTDRSKSSYYISADDMNRDILSEVSKELLSKGYLPFVGNVKSSGGLLENYLKQEWAYADGGLLNTLYNPTQFNINSTNNILYKRGGKINKGSYSTVLNKKREAEFQDWYSKIAEILNLDSNPDNQEHGYDYRGYWLENRKKDIDYSSPEFHFPDTWKQPWHETFSNESQYANMRYGINPKSVGHWEGETFIPGVYNDIMGGRSPQSEFLKTKEWAEKLIGPPKPSMVYTPSNSIIEYIKNTEGFSPVWYKDGNGVDTIGYGFTGEEVKKLFPNGITKEQADKYFSESLAKRVKVLQRDTPNWDVLNQNQRDSLLSYHYNIGEGSYRNKSPKMQKALREKDWKTVTENIDFGYNDSANRGLRKRRDYERALFNTPVETKTTVQYKCGGKLKRKNRIYVE